jgi:hypothetical protein
LGDHEELARLLDRACRDRAFLTELERQCAERAPLFAPEREQAAVVKLVDDALTAVTPQ